MESPKTKVIWYLDVPPDRIHFDAGQLTLWIDGGQLRLWLDPNAIDTTKPLRISLAQPSQPPE